MAVEKLLEVTVPYSRLSLWQTVQTRSDGFLPLVLVQIGQSLLLLCRIMIDASESGEAHLFLVHLSLYVAESLCSRPV